MIEKFIDAKPSPGSAIDSVMDDMRTEIIDFTVKQPRVEETGIKVIFNIWDFGGQQVYYTSHQTFLSKRAVYLLVMDMSKPLDAEIEKIGDNQTRKDTGTTARGTTFMHLLGFLCGGALVLSMQQLCYILELANRQFILPTKCYKIKKLCSLLQKLRSM